MPSPYCAKSGIVTGRWPVMGISPISAFTTEVSEGVAVLNAAR